MYNLLAFVAFPQEVRVFLVPHVEREQSVPDVYEAQEDDVTQAEVPVPLVLLLDQRSHVSSVSLQS